MGAAMALRMIFCPGAKQHRSPKPTDAAVVMMAGATFFMPSLIVVSLLGDSSTRWPSPGQSPKHSVGQIHAKPVDQHNNEDHGGEPRATALCPHPAGSAKSAPVSCHPPRSVPSGPGPVKLEIKIEEQKTHAHGGAYGLDNRRGHRRGPQIPYGITLLSCAPPAPWTAEGTGAAHDMQAGISRGKSAPLEGGQKMGYTVKTMTNTLTLP